MDILVWDSEFSRLRTNKPKADMLLLCAFFMTSNYTWLFAIFLVQKKFLYRYNFAILCNCELSHLEIYEKHLTDFIFSNGLLKDITCAWLDMLGEEVFIFNCHFHPFFEK